MALLIAEEDFVIYKTGFDKDNLDRNKFANQLSELINKATEPFVIALDGKWGSGKSYFLKRWVKHHSPDKATTVYFDAFENDYLSEPLISIISSVNDRIPKEYKQNWKHLGFKIAKPLASIGLNLLTFGAEKKAAELIGVALDAAQNEIEYISNKFWEAEDARKNSMNEFKILLTKVATDEKPLVIVVDELDRCRPDYALSVLEVIKHFFSVPNVHFILGVNLIALENSVKAQYGAGTDATNYLNKFIHIKTNLPDKIGKGGEIDAIEKYFITRSSEMSLNKDFQEKCKKVILSTKSGNNISLRDIQKICTKIKLTPKPSSGDWNNSYTWVASILIVASVINENFHKNLIDERIDAKEILEFLGMKESDTFVDENGDGNSTFNHETQMIYSFLCHCCFGQGCKQLKICESHFHNIKTNTLGNNINHKWMLTIQRDFVDVFKAF